MDVILIAAVTQDGFIARHENEVTSWTKDLWLFKQQTLGYPVIMGSNTWATLKTELKNKLTKGIVKPAPTEIRIKGEIALKINCQS